MKQSVIKALLQVLRDDQILLNDQIPDRHHADWGDTPNCRPEAVLLPESTSEVSEILQVCHGANQPVVVQGGMTGLAGSATPQQAEVALSLEKMTGVEEIDSASMSMSVRAGTTLGDIHRRLEKTNYVYGIDYGARDLAQIGGNIATNAGGTQVIRYGMSRAQVLGLEAVLADGTVLSSMNRLLKNNAGYDVKQLFIGTEGTLGVITRAQLRLFPKPAGCCTAMFAVDNYDSCLMILSLCRGLFAETLTGFEVMWRDYYTAACRAIEEESPIETKHSIYILVEVRGQNQQSDWARLHELFQQSLDENIIQTGVLAESEKEGKALWNIRFAVKNLLRTMPPLANFDVGIPTAKMQDFLDEVERTLHREFSKIDILAFGHIGDGNVHLMISTDHQQDVARIYSLVYPLSRLFDGTVTAEHGVGVHKKNQLSMSRTDAEIELMRTLKNALDPRGILNKGRIFDID